MKVARSLGVAPKRFWGWEPEEVHEHEYDSEGRLARTVVIRESEFDPEQQELLAALQEYEADLGPHGFPRSETMSPDADPDNKDGKYRYEPVVSRDFALDALERIEKQYSGENYSSARLFSVVRVER